MSLQLSNSELLCDANGYGLPCRTIGGVSPYGVFLSPWNCPNNIGGTSTGLNYTFNPDGSIGTFSYGATPSQVSNLQTFVQFCQDDEIASLIMTPDASNVKANGTFYSANAVEFTMFRMNQYLINELNIIGNGRWQGVVIGNDGKYYFIGLYHPASITSASGGINKMMGDLNGMTLTLESHEQYGLTLISGTQGYNPLATQQQIQESAAHAVQGLLSYNLYS